MHEIEHSLSLLKNILAQGYRGHPRVIIRKFSEDQSKTLPVGLYFSFKITRLGSQLCA